MDRRRKTTTTTTMSSSIERNMHRIAHLRRNIRNLEQETAEIRQRLNMILEELNENREQNYDLRLVQQEVDAQLQFQNALNVELEEELIELRRIVARGPQHRGANNAPNQDGNAPNANPAPRE